MDTQFLFLVIINLCSNISSSPCFQFFWVDIKRGITRLYSRSVFTFVGNHQIIVHSGCIILHSHQPRMSSRCSMFSKAAFGVVSGLNSHHFNNCAIVSHWIMPLVLYLKSHRHTQGHLGFFLCYLLGISFIF